MAEQTFAPGLDAAVFGPGREVFVERSVKFRPGARSGERMLYGVKRQGAVGLRPLVLDLARRIGLTAAMCDEIDLRFAAALMIHAGQEGSGRDAVIKLYLEFASPPPDLPDLRFLAWKAPQTGAPLRSTYHRIAAATAAEHRVALDSVALPAPLRAAAGDLLDLACARVDAAELTHLRVTEPGTPRASFDLNLYDAGLSMDEAAPAFGPSLRALGHDPADPGFPGDARLGHVSAGLGRDGIPFWTLYGDARLQRAPA